MRELVRHQSEPEGRLTEEVLHEIGGERRRSNHAARFALPAQLFGHAEVRGQAQCLRFAHEQPHRHRRGLQQPRHFHRRGEHHAVALEVARVHAPLLPTLARVAALKTERLGGIRRPPLLLHPLLALLALALEAAHGGDEITSPVPRDSFVGVLPALREVRIHRDFIVR